MNPVYPCSIRTCRWRWGEGMGELVRWVESRWAIAVVVQIGGLVSIFAHLGCSSRDETHRDPGPEVGWLMTKAYTGFVVSGLGVAKERVLQNKALYERVSGMCLVPGTLNILLSNSEFEIPKHSSFIPPDMVQPLKKKRGVTLVPAKLGNEDVVIIVPDNSVYGKRTLEVMASF